MSQSIKDAEALLRTTAGAAPLPETREEKQKREHREWEASLRLDNNIPPLTEGEIIRSVETGRGVWRSIESLRAEALAAQAREERARRREAEAPELRIIEEPIF